MRAPGGEGREAERRKGIGREKRGREEGARFWVREEGLGICWHVLCVGESLEPTGNGWAGGEARARGLAVDWRPSLGTKASERQRKIHE